MAVKEKKGNTTKSRFSDLSKKLINNRNTSLCDYCVDAESKICHYFRFSTRRPRGSALMIMLVSDWKEKKSLMLTEEDKADNVAQRSPTTNSDKCIFKPQDGFRYNNNSVLCIENRVNTHQS